MTETQFTIQGDDPENEYSYIEDQLGQRWAGWQAIASALAVIVVLLAVLFGNALAANHREYRQITQLQQELAHPQCWTFTYGTGKIIGTECPR
jgi:hypothetical protein